MRTNYGNIQIDIDERTGRAKMLSTRPTLPLAPISPMTGPPVLPDPDQPRYRSKLEARYAGYLEARQHVGEIRDIRYEALQVTLARNTTLRPDFFLDMPDRTVEIHEVKGERVWEDSWVKLKIAARLWPWFRWFLVRRKKGEWIIKRIPSA